VARAVLLAASLLVALALCELGLRVFLPVRSSSELARLHMLRPDKSWLYGMRPNSVVEGRGGIRYDVNADGFRGPRAARPKNAGTLRLAVLGDSVTFGYGVNDADTFPTLLAARLAGARPVEVLNLGVSGYNPYTEAALFADLGPAFTPDVVLVQFCINDLNDPTMHFDASTNAALGALPDAAFPDPRTRRPAPRDCHGFRICELVRDAIRSQPAANDPAAIRATVEPHDPPGDAELAWLAGQYREIGRTARSIGARPVLVIFPYSTQLGTDAPSGIGPALTAVAAELGWPAIDLLPAFREGARQGTALFTDLWHPTPAGFRIAADVTASELRRAGLAN
jgi:lysophospholipase L1-like esterase